MRTSFRHQSEAQPPNGPLTAAASPDTPSTTPATQSVSECAGTSERERVSILTSLQSWIVTLVNYLACVAGGFFACFFACFAAAVSSILLTTSGLPLPKRLE
jgi:hypothetical protein